MQDTQPWTCTVWRAGRPRRGEFAVPARNNLSRRPPSGYIAAPSLLRRWADAGKRNPGPEAPVAARLDDIDRLILRELQDNGRITNVELARRVGISAPPCLRRVRALEEAGYIKGYR